MAERPARRTRKKGFRPIGGFQKMTVDVGMGQTAYCPFDCEWIRIRFPAAAEALKYCGTIIRNGTVIREQYEDTPAGEQCTISFEAEEGRAVALKGDVVSAACWHGGYSVTFGSTLIAPDTEAKDG